MNDTLYGVTKEIHINIKTWSDSEQEKIMSDAYLL